MSGPTTLSRSYRLLVSGIVIAVALAVAVLRTEMRGETRIAGPTDRDPVAISADFAHTWTAKNGVRVLVLRGHCRIVQGDATLRAQRMVVWQTSRGNRDAIAVYLEENVRVEQPGSTFNQTSSFINLLTRAGVDFNARVASAGTVKDALFRRAASRRIASRRGGLQPTQLVVQSQTNADPLLRSVRIQTPTGGLRRIRISPRSTVPFSLHSEKSTATTPAEQISIITGGVNLLIDGIEEFGTVDLTADRMVIWTRAVDADKFGNRTETLQTRDSPFQVYLEGNIVVRQGDNIVRASRAFYDAREDRALLLNAELTAKLAKLGAQLRVRAERLRQLSQKSFHAQQAWISTSRFGKPGYRLQSSDIFLEHRYVNPWIGQAPAFDPLTGVPVVDEVPWVSSLNNTFMVNNVPLMFAPNLSGPAEDPNIPLRSATIEQDRIFGSQVKTVWNMFKLLGVDQPQAMQWDLLADYLSERGPAFGTQSEYRGAEAFGIPGTFSGFGLGYYIYDSGNDNLGLDRRNLVPDDQNRRRALWRHRQNLPGDITVLGELGFVSDRNFLEQYYENEFDEHKDIETLLYLKQGIDNWAGTLFFRTQLNDFENTTEWYPRGDLYVLSQPLLGGLLTWTGRTSAGFANMRAAAAPTDPTDIFSPLPFAANTGGGVFMTRHELNLPFNVGPVQLVPYAMGEAAYWGEDATGDGLDRFVGSAGVRGSVLFWRVFPYVQSQILNLNGLAHKMVFDWDYSFTDVSRRLGRIPQYNEFDDNSQERFRQRFLINTFVGVLPAEFEPRFYAVRTGAGRSVTAAYHELIDQQQVLRFGWRHRWQTKDGPPDRLRIKDWMKLDLEGAFFPNADRDNFGEDLGLLSGRYSWLVGDRTRLLANAYYDLFDNSQKLWSVGVLSQRSSRGSIYAGVRQVKGGGFDSQIVTSSFSYAMSPKWISTLGTAYDLGEQQNRGQSLTITRVGADFLIHFGASFDESKGNAGIAVAIEPRFGTFDASSTQLSNLLRTR